MAEAPHRDPVADWATDFDHYAPEFVDDPFTVNAEIRDRCPVAHTDRYGGMNVPVTFELVAEAAKRTDDFTSRRTVISEIPTDRRGIILPPINMDPPDHTGARRVMLPFFNPNNTLRWEPAIREICDRLLDGLDGRDGEIPRARQ